MKNLEQTLPKSRGIFPETDTSILAHSRYGTKEMGEIWGAKRTFQFSLDAQAAAIRTMSDLYPDIIPPEHAEELIKNANLKVIDPNRIRELEIAKKHDVVAIDTAWEEKVSAAAATHINKARTSADTTETAKALQLKRSIEVIVDSIENLRDIVIEKSVNWAVPHIDTTHLLDALPTLAGGPFAFYSEMLQSDIDLLAHFYKNSIKGKWADVTGRHHSATSLGINGMKLQAEYCKRLEIGFMDAPAQVPGREFISDIVYGLTRTLGTMNGLALYIELGKGDDFNLFFDANPEKRKGSSAMPHKDVKGGNPIVEEQTESMSYLLSGALITSINSIPFIYCRQLNGSASDRIILDDAFKCSDHVIRDLAKTVYYLGLNEERSKERVHRTFGIVTSEQVMTYLTDIRKTSSPLPRGYAHNLIAKLATESYTKKINFLDVLLANKEVSTRLSKETLIKITDPEQFIGQTKEVIQTVFEKYYKKKADLVNKT